VVQVKNRRNPEKVTTRRVWNCKACKKQFTAKVGTIFEDSPLGLDKWLPAVWMIVNAKNGVSSCELARSLGVTQKTAWHMGHRIRLAMREGSFNLAGEVEADETFIGGRARNVSAKRRQKNPLKPMTPVFGVLERSEEKGHSRVALEVMDSLRRPLVHKLVRDKVEKGSALYTDAFGSYRGLGNDYMHAAVDHGITYAMGKVHTNGLENFWSLLKRTLRGTYVKVDAAHLYRYLDEQATRFNERKHTDGDRFVNTMKRVSGRRLPYVALTANPWRIL
jgi:transposase-like protein